MLAQTGLDFAFIDTEHIPLGREHLSWMCQTFGALGMPPIVRIPECTAALANMAVDAGATINTVVADPANNIVVLCFSEQDIVAGHTVNGVIAPFTV